MNPNAKGIDWDVSFWKESTRKTFDEKANQLMASGYAVEEAKELLEDLYLAVSDEYGG